MRAWRILLTAAVLCAAGATAAWAASGSGNQNPQLLVKVSLKPTHAVTGNTIVARTSVTNTTGRTLKRVQTDFELDTPATGTGVGEIGNLPAGATWSHTFRLKVKSTTPHGSVLVTASASDAAGKSHARAGGSIG
jgi:hypothetical protein